MDTLVLGIGNTLLTDEGNGVHVVQYLFRQHPNLPGVTYLDGGTLSFTLSDAIQAHHYLVVVDAAEFHAEPGTVKVLENEEMDAFLRGPRRSVHEVSLMDLMDIARLTDSLPQKRALIGIQAYSTDWGENPSLQCAEAIPLAAQQVLNVLEAWRE